MDETEASFNKKKRDNYLLSSSPVDTGECCSKPIPTSIDIERAGKTD
jgi:hypothetical protein